MIFEHMDRIVFAGDYVLNLITIECMKRSLPGIGVTV